MEINKKKILIEEYGEEYKSLLNKFIYEYREDPTEMVDISDLSLIDRHAKSIFRITDQTRKKNRIINLIGILGVIYAAIGCILLLITYLIVYAGGKTFDHTEYIVYVVFTVLCVVGTIFNLTSVFLKIKESKKYMSYGRITNFYENSTKSSEFQIIMIWKEIELLLFKLSPEDIQTNLKSILKFLSDVKVIDKKDEISISQIRECRNNILHSNTFIKNNDMQSIINKGNNIIMKLYSKL